MNKKIISEEGLYQPPKLSIILLEMWQFPIFEDNVNVVKFRTLCSQIKCWLSWLELNKSLSGKQTRQTLIRLLLQKQSDLGLLGLSRLLWQATDVGNFRSFTIMRLAILYESSASTVPFKLFFTPS